MKQHRQCTLLALSALFLACALHRPLSAQTNGIYYISQFSGGDLGARMNAAVTACTPANTSCKYIVDIGGTISTSPAFPIGSIVEFTNTSPITLATSWLMQHHGVYLDFHDRPITANTGTSAAIDIGKASALNTTLVDTSGTTVTWRSGPNFSDLDLGDQLVINGNTYNISSINGNHTMLTLAASAGSQTLVQLVGLMVPENAISNNPTVAPLTLRGVNLIAGTSTGTAVRSTFVSNLQLESPKIFGAFGFGGFYSRGSLLANVYASHFVGNQVLLRSYTFGGNSSPSNHNRFFGGDIVNAVNTASGGLQAFEISNSTDNVLYGFRLEGNSTTQGLYIASSTSTACFGCYLERTGDGTSGSDTINISGSTGTTIENTFMTDVGVSYNHNGNAILLAGITPGTAIRNVTINGNGNSYGTAIHCLNSGGLGSAFLDSNQYVGAFTSGTAVAGCTTSALVDASGNGNLTSVTAGQGVLVGSLPSASANPGTMIYVTDSTSISSEGQQCVGGSSNKALALSNGSVWKCF
jgi:hypothetical protein